MPGRDCRSRWRGTEPWLSARDYNSRQAVLPARRVTQRLTRPMSGWRARRPRGAVRGQLAAPLPRGTATLEGRSLRVGARVELRSAEGASARVPRKYVSLRVPQKRSQCDLYQVL
ncbi:uncharacterized protein VK521_005684 [Ammospiza maritima maritima]